MKLGQGQGYLKAGFLGFSKAGKTHTAVELAIGTRAVMGLSGPIAMFDTEGGSEYVAEWIRQATGQDPVGARSMALDDLLDVTRACEQEGVSVLIVDSLTHVWRELTEAYLARINEGRAKRRLPPRGMEFQDWGPVKRVWAKWTDLYLNSKLHIIICGRAGFEYDYETNDEGKKELVKTGTKMKVESEFGFEPSLLIEMERVLMRDKRRGKVTLHRATVIGDRFGLIDGKTRDNPTFKFFEPYILRLKPGAHAPIDTALKSDAGVNDYGHDDRRQRDIALEEIEGELVTAFPATQGKDRVAKLAVLERVFGTKSWEAIRSRGLAELRDGLATIRDELRAKASTAPDSGPELPRWASADA